MTIDKYPITRLNVLPRSFTNSGYQIWYWFVGMSALTCPIEPLTPDFWQKKQKSILVYGIVLPAIDKEEGGELLVMVSQRLTHAQKNGVGKLSAQQRQDLYNLVFHLDFLQITGFQQLPAWNRINFFRAYEKAFLLHILPTKDGKGKYRRKLLVYHKNHILRSNLHGEFKCPKCSQPVGIGKGLVVLDNLYDDDGTIFMTSVCERCDEFVKLSIDAHLNRSSRKSLYLHKVMPSSAHSQMS